MKHILTAALLTLGMIAGAGAADPSPAQKAQQEKMSKCNKDAEGKTGDDRKAFMKTCLSAKAAAPSTQQDKMKICNADAKGKTGDDRKAFMKDCLSAKPA